MAWHQGNTTHPGAHPEPSAIGATGRGRDEHRSAAGGNKFEPQRTGSRGATTIGGQKHSGSTSIGSTLGEIVKGIKEALAHD